MDRRTWIRCCAGGAALVSGGAVPAVASSWSTSTVVFALRNPGCGCCLGWADHLRSADFLVHIHDSVDLASVKDRLGIPLELRSCHTAVVEGYRIEGHVPAGPVRRLLVERPAIAGLAVAGMPIGSPGMEGPDAEPYDVMAFRDDGEQFVFERITP